MHWCVTSKNVKWCHLIWPTLYIQCRPNAELRRSGSVGAVTTHFWWQEDRPCWREYCRRLPWWSHSFYAGQLAPTVVTPHTSTIWRCAITMNDGKTETIIVDSGINPATPTVATMCPAIKHPVPDRVKPSLIYNFWHPGTLTLRAVCTRVATVVVKGLSRPTRCHCTGYGTSRTLQDAS